MPTAFGYLLLAAGLLVIRQVIVGRVSDTAADLRDLSVGLLSGDMETVREVSSRRGENVSPEVSLNTSGDTLQDFRSQNPGNTLGDFYGLIEGGNFAGQVMKLGNAASGYTLGATGPDRYDCSGLIWRAMKENGIYTGPRFTTSTFAQVAPNFATRVDSPQPGDIILWPTRHMGVSLGGDRMYSARSSAKGIGESSVSGDSGYFGTQPSYWRITSNET